MKNGGRKEEGWMEEERRKDGGRMEEGWRKDEDESSKKQYLSLEKLKYVRTYIMLWWV